MTLQTVADKVGVSRMTVSNAFSRPDQLSAPLRDRILAAAADLGYIGPDPAARALARGTTSTVGIVLTSLVQSAFADEVATAFLGAIASELAPSGLSLTLLSTVETAGRVPARDVPMDGAVVFHCDPRSPALDWLQRRRLPMVYVDQIPAPDIPSVNVDDRGGARAGAEHLLGLGHRRIGIVSADIVPPYGVVSGGGAPDRQSYVAYERIAGWREVLTAAGVEPVVVNRPHPTEGDGYEALEALLDADPSVTGVLCFADTLAHGVMLAAQNRGLVLPQDLSVVGFDDNPLASRLRPALTTVRQDVHAKGRLAASALVELVEAARSDEPPAAVAAQIVLPTELVVRESTAAPRS
ncbi:LacI family DNA-binding transcriptional regulator [Nakamurella deserti]|uniref:LacI family DNA-binding transcriptional regulator n=1 Tax=Nakamurella deserti TaxID=2164074 RepID=UPI00197C7506|nr:LacI family DNA-binding transcriptional regulator [Nakamurella deserti]